jgi:hypothetical protein
LCPIKRWYSQLTILQSFSPLGSHFRLSPLKDTMKFLSAILIAITATATFASPVGEQSNAEARGLSSLELEARADRRCSIVGSSANVNCRYLPNTSEEPKRTLPLGSTWTFVCYRSGQCITLNGSTNWWVSLALGSTTSLTRTNLIAAGTISSRKGAM